MLKQAWVGHLQAREQLRIMEINGRGILPAMKHLSISAVGKLKTSLDLIRQFGYERGKLSESEFTDIFKKYKYKCSQMC